MVREYTYVKDIVDGCIKLANHRQNFGEAFNFGSESILNVLEVVKKAEEALGVKVNYQVLNTAKHEIQAQYLDWNKAREVLGWQPRISFQEGLKETLAWFKKVWRCDKMGKLKWKIVKQF